MRIAFDLDGVFADMEGALAREAKALFGTVEESETGSDIVESAGSARAGCHAEAETARADRKNELPPVRLPITARQQRRLWKHVETIDNFWETLDEIEPGSLARLSALSASRQWEIIFLTRRPGSAGATAQVQSQRWLKAKGFAWPSVFVVQGSRGRIAAALALDLVVDDTPENCLDVVVDSKARSILVWRDEHNAPPIAAKRLGIGVVKSVEECLDILSQVDSSSHEGVVDRVKRLLGVQRRRRTAKTEA